MYSSLREPLVSIAIINRNYGRFVGEAIQSVKEQTYKNVEGLVLDNGSDDNSVDIIEEAIARDPKFRFFRVAENLGHLGGGLWLLDHLNGEFVTFLDADDILSPEYAAAHVQAHLASGFSTAFTSSNYLDIDANGVIHTGGSGVMQHWWPVALRCIRVNPRLPRVAAVDDRAFRALCRGTRFSPPGAGSWSWSQGSSNMFRRIMLERVRPSGLGPIVLGGVDAYFTPLLNAITGTLLINLPLSLYRIHGGNDYSALPGLYGVRTGTEAPANLGASGFLLGLDFLIRDVDMALRTVPEDRYWSVLDAVMSAGKYKKLIAHPGAKALLTKNLDRLIRVFGKRSVYCELRLRMKLRDFLDIINANRNGLLRASDLGDWLAAEFRRAKQTSFTLAKRVWRGRAGGASSS